MGWTSSYVPKSIKTADYVKSEFTHGVYEVVAQGTGARRGRESVYYTAVKNTETGQVSAVISLVQRTKWELAIKSYGEEAGPVTYDCPKKVFEALTPTTSEWANQWRAEVAKQLANPKPKPKVGDTIKFADEISFTNGFIGTTFVYYGGSKFRSIHGGGYRITNWNLKPYEILAIDNIEEAVA